MPEIAGGIVVLFGLLLGSFINVLIYRIPRGIDFVAPRSRCESCKTLIKWYQNIPVASFLLLGGKSACCGRRISWRHPLVEIIVGIVAYLLFPKHFNWMSFIHFLFFFTVFCALVVHFFIDLDFQILPDGVNLYLAVLFLIYSLFFHPWTHWALGGLVGFGIPYGITWLFYKVRGKIGMGGGDIKLYAALGLYLGPQQIVVNIFLSCFLGSLVGLVLIFSKRAGRETPIAFGPFIVIAALFQIFFPRLQRGLLSFLFV